MKTVVGKLVNVSGRFWYFVTDDGEELRIHFEGDDRPPVEEHIALAISDEPEYEDGGYACLTDGKYWVYNGAAGVTDPTNKRIALYWQHKPGQDKDKEREIMADWAREIERFYKHYSRDKWYVEVRPFLYEGTCNPEPPMYCAMDIGNKVDLGDFKPTYHHVVSYFSNSSYCGLGNINGNRGATYLYGGNCTVHTAIHEIGHNLGLHHANDHTDGEYRDKTCVMGMGPHTPGLNAPHLLELGVETDREKLTINQSTQVLICPIEMSFLAMHDNEWQHVVLEKDGQTKYYVSLRKQKGWPWDPGSKDENVLYIHYRKDGKSWLWDTMGPNSTTNPKTLPNGVKLHYHEYANETARVTFDYGDGVEVEELAMPSGFPEVFTGAELGPEHSGLWYNPDFWGQGFDLCVKNGRMTIYWYTYNVEESSRRFYWGTADLGSGAEVFKLYTTKNGTFEDSKSGEVVEVGEGQIYFTGPESGRFEYNTTEHGRGGVSIQPIALSDHPLSGLWYEQSPDVKTGFSAQFFPHLNKAVMYWYTYGKRLTNSQRRGIETQRWFMCDCARLNDTQFHVTIYELRDGAFGTFTKPTVHEVGSGQLSVVDADHLEFAYNISADSSTTGIGTMYLDRLF